MKQFILAMLISTVSVFLIMSNGSAAGQYFSDVPPSHWAYDYVQQLYESGISQGYQDGTYQPGNNVSRAEMAAYTVRTISHLKTELCDYYSSTGQPRPDFCPYIVFVSSLTYTGNLGGLSGADVECNTLASAAGLPGTYKAWLSDSVASASSRLTHNSHAYGLSDRVTVIANNWTDLTDGNLDHAINMDENGASIIANKRAWTNTTMNGSIRTVTADGTCNNWQSSNPGIGGLTGLSTANNADWTWYFITSCDSPLRLYCFEQ